MKIIRAKYLENGYFEVKYSGCDPVIQDIGAIKMQSPSDNHLKDFLLFMRRIKLDKIEQKDDFDELKYRDSEVFPLDDGMKGIRAYASAHTVPKQCDLDDLLGAL